MTSEEFDVRLPIDGFHLFTYAGGGQVIFIRFMCSIRLPQNVWVTVGMPCLIPLQPPFNMCLGNPKLILFALIGGKAGPYGFLCTKKVIRAINSALRVDGSSHHPRASYLYFTQSVSEKNVRLVRKCHLITTLASVVPKAKSSC